MCEVVIEVSYNTWNTAGHGKFTLEKLVANYSTLAAQATFQFLIQSNLIKEFGNTWNGL